MPPPEYLAPEGVIFDMDGLLLDTERPVFDLWPRGAAALGWEVSPEQVRCLIGVNEAAERVFLEEQLGPGFPYEAVKREVYRLMTEEFSTHGIALKPGVLPLLDHLQALGIPWAIATSTSRQRAVEKLRFAGIEGRFHTFAFGDEVTVGKPGPEIFLLAAERLGKAPAHCLGFEDSPAGLRGLHSAGIPSVFIKDLLEPPPEVLARVWKRCNTLDEIIPFIIKLIPQPATGC